MLKVLIIIVIFLTMSLVSIKKTVILVVKVFFAALHSPKGVYMLLISEQSLMLVVGFVWTDVAGMSPLHLDAEVMTLLHPPALFIGEETTYSRM